MTPAQLAQSLLDLIPRIGGAPLPDNRVLVPRAWLDDALSRGLGPEIEAGVLPALDALVAAHVQAHGWFMPPVKQSPEDALAQVRRASDKMLVGDFSGAAHSGGPWLKSLFSSYWSVQGGAAHAVHDPKKRLNVLRYRLGLNARQETFDVSLASIRFGFVVGGHAVSFFKPAVAAAIYRRWCPDTDTPRIWDPSGGFGARMLGFFAAFPGGSYVCNEPATATRADLTALAGRLRPHLSPGARVEVYAGGSEVEGPPGLVDLVFTSPPYFNKERYFDEPGQCWRDFPTLDAWVAGYLTPTLTRARDALARGGHIVLNVSADMRDLLLSTAKGLGLVCVQEHKLILQRSHLNRRHGVTEAHGEPVLVFRRASEAPPVALIEKDGAEQWRPVQGTQGRYEVSDHGRVRSHTRGRTTILAGTAQGAGYRAIGVTAEPGGKATTELVHRLIALTFLGEPPTPEHTDVRHLDGNKDNNRLENLAWGTRSQNMQDVVRHRRQRKQMRGLTYPPPPERAEARNGWYAGRTADAGLVQACLAVYDDGGLTLVDMARILDCSAEIAGNIAAGRTHRAVIGVERKGKARRNKARRLEIQRMIAAGHDRDSVNEVLAETLTHQDFYYYKSKTIS